MPRSPKKLSAADKRRIDNLVKAFKSNRPKIALFLQQIRAALSDSVELAPHIHSLKWRIKDPEHLRDKLSRKLLICKQKKQNFDITPDNLLVQINDLPGVRILHLHTRQIQDIDRAVQDIFAEQRYDLLEGPLARTWDDESREFFGSCGIQTQDSPTLYTSVHYVVGSASRTRITCEIQVRTLMEEVWGEVDHEINYPHPVDSVACREQIKVLARVTSSATRLVDSIFATVRDSKTQETAPKETSRRSSSKAARRDKQS